MNNYDKMLKPCPFCGNKKPWIATNEDNCGRNIEFTISCGDNDCGCDIGWYESPEDAAEKWNTRIDRS